MRLVVVGIWLALVVVRGEARADADTRARAARSRLDTQIKALQEAKLDAFAALFPDTPSAAVMFPASKAPAVGRKAIRDAAKDWAGPRTKSIIAVNVVGTPVVSQREPRHKGARSEKLVVINADIALTLSDADKPVTLRATSVLIEGFEPKAPKVLVTVALFVTEPIEDKHLRAEASPGDGPTPDRFVELLRSPDLLAKRFDGDEDDLVIDYGPRDRAVGPAAKQLLARWRGRKLAIVGQSHVAARDDWVYAMATVSMTRKTGKPAPLEVLLVGYRECKASCVGNDMVPHVVAIHVGQSH